LLSSNGEAAKNAFQEDKKKDEFKIGEEPKIVAPETKNLKSELNAFGKSANKFTSQEKETRETSFKRV